MKKYNIGISVILILISAAMLVSAKSMPLADGVMGAGSWPAFLAVIMIVLSLALLAQSLMDRSEKEGPFQMGPGLKRVLAATGVMVVFCVLLKFLGFMIAAAFMVPAVMRVMSEKRIWMLAVVTVGVLASVYLIFAVALHLPLPQGSLL